MPKPTSQSTSKQKMSEMLPVQIKLTVGMIQRLDVLVKAGHYNSRSEAIRNGVRELIYR